MWRVLMICTLLSALAFQADAARYHKRSAAGASAGGFASSYAGAGTGGGYTGTYTDGGDGFNYGFGYAPTFGFGFIDPYLFHQQLTAQILAQHAAQQSAIASTTSTGDASVTADASTASTDELIQNQLAQQQAFFDNLRRQTSYDGFKTYKGNRYAPNFALASGAVSPGGNYQTAFISPENPELPNIVSRFSESTGPGGFKGVSVSSYSSSSDINGQRTSHRGAQTTINDNGKITTYRVHS